MIDLTEAWTAIGHWFQLGLMNRIFRQQGIDGAAYSPRSVSTIRGAARRKAGDRYVHFTYVKEGRVGGSGVMRKGTHRSAAAMSYDSKRMWHTGHFAKGAFDFLADATGVSVFVKDSFYVSGWGALDPSKRQTFAQILRWNSRNFDEVNDKIVDPPLIFPQTAQEVGLMKEEVQFARYTLSKALTTEFEKIIPKQVEIYVG
jgi:hypothetical protein